MAVSISKPAINLREELTQLKSPAIIKPQRFQTFWFENLVTNGTFDTDSDWTLDSGWSISGGVLSKATGSGNGVAASQAVNFVAGRNYIAKFDYTDQGTDIAFGYGTLGTYSGLSQNSLRLSGTGAKTINVAPLFNGGFLGFLGNDTWVGQVDNVSIYQADPSDDAPWYRMPLGWKPFQVFEDGSLIREGSTHDYEVIFDGYTYFVKPSVAPGVSTETQIVGVAT